MFNNVLAHCLLYEEVNELNTTGTIKFTGLEWWNELGDGLCFLHKEDGTIFRPLPLCQNSSVSFVEGRLLAICTECIHFNFMYVTFHPRRVYKSVPIQGRAD